MQAFILWILEHTFEKFSHWWQRTVWMEQDCFWWARTCISAMIGTSVFITLVTVSLQGVEAIASAIGTVFCFWFFGWMFINIAKFQEEDTSKSHARGCANPAKKYLFYLGFIFVGLLGLPLVLTARLVTAEMSFGIAFLWGPPYTMFFSFIACDPLPKAGNRSKLQNFLDRVLVAPPQPAESES